MITMQIVEGLIVWRFFSLHLVSLGPRVVSIHRSCAQFKLDYRPSGPRSDNLPPRFRGDQFADLSTFEKIAQPLSRFGCKSPIGGTDEKIISNFLSTYSDFGGHLYAQENRFLTERNKIGGMRSRRGQLMMMETSRR